MTETSGNSSGKVMDWIRRFLTHKHLPIRLTVIAFLLASPSLFIGFQLDDYFHQLVMDHLDYFPASHRAPNRFFSFVDGEPETTDWLMKIGLLPWWTAPELKLSFWRPVTVLTHLADYALWPDQPFFMHLQSLFWFAGVIAIATLLYRRFSGFTITAGLAALLFALDDAHGMPAGWLANRNALIATFFSLLTLWYHHRYRRTPRIGFFMGALVSFTLGLLAGELAISCLAYLAAYAVFLDDSPLRNRFASLIPYAIIVTAWWFARSHFGAGTAGSELYIDPSSEPLRFLGALIERAPLLLLGQTGVPIAGLYLFKPDWIPVIWIVSMLFCTGFAFLLAPLLKSDRTARFYTSAMLLSLVPICSTFPHERLLFMTGFGAMGLMAQLMVHLSRQVKSPVSTPWYRHLMQTILLFLITIHLVAAPLMLPVSASTAKMLEPLIDEVLASITDDGFDASDTLIMINPPLPFFAQYLPIVRIVQDMKVPREYYVLAPGTTDLTITRSRDDSLAITAARGFVSAPFDAMFRASHFRFEPGDTINLGSLKTVIQTITSDGRPETVQFTFTGSLDAKNRVWLYWDGNRFIRFPVPGNGETVHLPAQDLWRYLVGQRQASLPAPE